MRGLSFDKLEINMKNEKLLTLEIILIGPSISVLMEAIKIKMASEFKETLVLQNLNTFCQKLSNWKIIIPKKWVRVYSV